MLSATAVNLIRVDAWLNGTPLGTTRISHLARLDYSQRARSSSRSDSRPRARKPASCSPTVDLMPTSCSRTALVHSFRAASGPVMRASSGKVAAMMPSATRIPPAVMR